MYPPLGYNIGDKVKYLVKPDDGFERTVISIEEYNKLGRVTSGQSNADYGHVLVRKDGGHYGTEVGTRPARDYEVIQPVFIPVFAGDSGWRA
jgi:hypothetical protein